MDHDRILEAFRYLRLKVTLVPERRIGLPEYTGSMLRGALGYTLREAACSRPGGNCPDCFLYRTCAYPYLFNTPAPSEDFRGNKVPAPYIIEPPLERSRLVDPGEEWSFGLILLGRATEYLPYFVVALDLWRKSGIGPARIPVRLARIEALDYTGSPTQLVFSGDDRQPKPPNGFSNGCDLAHQLAANGLLHETWARVRFEVMTRLTYRGRLVDTPEFHIVVRALLRRAADILHVHCSVQPRWDFKQLVRASKTVELVRDYTRWYDWERYSRRQRSRMKLGGIWGEADYRGDLSQFRELLVLGSVMHVGKNATFGLGKISLLSSGEPHGCH